VDSQAGHEALSRFATAQSLDVRKHAREVEAQPRLLQRTISVGGRRCRVVAVIVPVGTHRVAVALANGRVGSTAPLGQIASSRGAVAAINGCYFDAYTSSKVKQPWHTIISNGSLCAIGNVGSVLGF